MDSGSAKKTHEFFFVTCNDPTCDGRLILPCNRTGEITTDIELGRYVEVDTSAPVQPKRSLGAHQYHSYRKAPARWPLRFACPRCGEISLSDFPVKSRIENSQGQSDLLAELQGVCIWPIEAQDSDSHYSDQTMTVYAVAKKINPPDKARIELWLNRMPNSNTFWNTRVCSPINYHPEYDFPI